MKKLATGDNVAGDGITTGKYLGTEKMYGRSFHKVFDKTKQMIVYFPFEEIRRIRRLPSKSTMLRSLNIFDNNFILDDGKIEGSRYKYYKEKLKDVSFKSTVEILHDVNMLVKNKKASVAERKMYHLLKDKVLNEVSYVLALSLEEIENQYLN